MKGANTNCIKTFGTSTKNIGSEEPSILPGRAKHLASSMGHARPANNTFLSSDTGLR